MSPSERFLDSLPCSIERMEAMGYEPFILIAVKKRGSVMVQSVANEFDAHSSRMLSEISDAIHKIIQPRVQDETATAITLNSEEPK